MKIYIVADSYESGIEIVMVTTNEAAAKKKMDEGDPVKRHIEVWEDGATEGYYY